MPVIVVGNGVKSEQMRVYLPHEEGSDESHRDTRAWGVRDLVL
jgi:hypothetical protein